MTASGLPLERADPADVAASLRAVGPLAFLDATSDDDGLGAWSYVASAPAGAMYAWGDRVLHVEGGRRRFRREDPFAALERRVRDFGAVVGERAVGDRRPLRAGAIGWLGYELGRVLERLPAPADDRSELPDLAFWFYPDVLAVDHRAGCWHGGPSLAATLASATPQPLPAVPAPTPVSAGFSRESYLAAVDTLHAHILAGDVYQVNLSQRFEGVLAEDPFALYRRLRARRPAPLGAYLEAGSRAVLSNSPERFLALRGRAVETRPIKGTRPRGASPAADRALVAELLGSEKDAAELTMIIDLLRNDLGKVATPGSVVVDDPGRLVTLPTVHHRVATVRATLEPGVGTAELLRATFPGGSITGCPKVRAMEIIAALEPCRRGVYTGAVGWLSVDGDLELSVAIRTLSAHRGRFLFHAGGGVVADSDPRAEYEETLYKARAFFEVFGVTGPAR